MISRRDTLLALGEGIGCSYDRAPGFEEHGTRPAPAFATGWEGSP